MPSPQEEIKEIGEKLNRDFNQFKEANDKRLAELAKMGTAGADREEKVNKISESLTQMEEKIESLKAVVNRAPTGNTEAELKATEAKQRLLSGEAVAQFMRKGRMSAEAAAAYIAELKTELGEHNPEFKSLSVGSDPDGGYFVRPQMSAEITKKVFESSPMREVSDVITISTDAFEEMYDNDEPDAGWVGEMTTRSESDTNQVSKIRIEAHELHASPKASQKLLDDSLVNIEAWHGGKVAEKFARVEATAFVSGNGVGKPKGFTGYASGTGFNQIQQVSSASSGAVTADSLLALQDALLEDFQNGALFMMKRSVWTTIRKLKDAENRYLVAVSGNLTAGDTRNLLGKPVKLAEDMAAAAADSLSVAYGNFKRGYLIVDRVGIRVLRDPYTTKGQVSFYTTKRTGGGVRHFQAIKLLVLSA